MAISWDDLIASLQSQFPQIWAIVNKPGVLQVLQDAITNDYAPVKTVQLLQQTPYFTQTPLAERQWDTLVATDPATAAQQSSQYQQRMTNLIGQTGVNPNAGVATQLLHDAIVNQWTDTEFKMNLLTRGANATNAAGQAPTAGGELASNAALASKMAADYGVPLSDKAAINWGSQLTSGAIDQAAIQGYMIDQAKSLYPSLTAALDAGVTVRHYVDPYAQIAQQELGINPDDFNLSDPKWSAPITQLDPKTGDRVAMTLQDWQTKLRTDATYGYDTTPQAAQRAAQLSTKVQQMFGSLG